MQSEIKICQNCKSQFVIDPEDFSFYEKIQVPPPTFCYECRTVRRLAFRNELNLYKRKCAAPEHGEEMISIYAPEKPLVIYDQKFWWTDGWDPFACGRPYDFSKPFFQQWLELRNSFPLMSVSNSNAINSDYCNVADQSKDCYLISGSFNCEKTMYSNRVNQIKDSSDLHVAHRSELCYDGVYLSDCYRVLLSKNCWHCLDAYFLYDCRNCSNCFGCVNLRNKQYCFFNEQLSKDEYAKRLKELDLGDYATVKKLKDKFVELQSRAIHKYADILHSVNVVGDKVDNAKNCYYAFDITDGAEDSKYIHWGGLGVQDVYDGGPGVGIVNNAYEVFDTGLEGSMNLFTSVVYGSNNVRYAFNCYNCSDLFGCIGLRSKQYCILNKQYAKEEYEGLVPKIIAHMNEMPYVDGRGRVYGYGEFFPMELSPFAYNESVAQDYFPLTKEEAAKRGYSWRENEERHYEQTMAASQLPDNIRDVSDDILKQVIECEHKGVCNDNCTVAFKFIPAELQFYRRIGIPLPHFCFKCRHYARLRQRHPLKTWRRQCACDYKVHNNTIKHAHHLQGRCSNEFETIYAPDRPEIVYCESCYNSEVV
ncbi:MAG: hypothetical protein HY445_00825 [Candidatus Niyogibacteria bacterium]|nr:hypothetical protein [Candidatus Niyogibacteria bacterium]